ncbi:helix-turn-helix domain-containing protein [Hydrogenovibrio kuenenii]|uniref:helix-turn-helix domain-containing protein n=1 Tax=Hydrogenovibrio kuenenii TaxID=63658 RepID=UPI000466A7E1|nr:helix-turn-helix transcriptional regulator [Hydrogenovibrio kuenenii]
MTNTVKLELHETLKTARKAQTLTLEMVSERLKLTKAQIEYFESPELDLDALNTFQRGYLRNYANMLSIDIGEFEGHFPEGVSVSSDLSRVEQDEAHHKPVISNRLMRWIMWGVIVLIVVVLIVINQ